MKLFQVYSGEEFNLVTKGMVFIKLTNKSEIHNDYEFHDGLNIDIVPFNPTGECKRGGIYFTDESRIHIWEACHEYYRIVTIPDNALVYAERDKWKANKIILSERREIKANKSYCTLIALRGDPEFLEFVEDQDAELCLAVVSRYGRSLKHVKYQTREICLAAVKSDFFSLDFVKDQTGEICLAAMKVNSDAAWLIRDKTLRQHCKELLDIKI